MALLGLDCFVLCLILSNIICLVFKNKTKSLGVV